MTPEQRIDAALDSVLTAMGWGIGYYAHSECLVLMREAMRQIMSESYSQGADDAHNRQGGDGWLR